MPNLNPFKWLRDAVRGEVRSTLADPDPWLQSWFNGGGTSKAGVIVNEQTALTISAVYQAVRVLSEAVASLPFPVYRRLDPRGRQRVRAHPVYRLLDEQPNDEMTAYTLRETLMGHVLLWGNGYAEIERAGDGTPLALHVLRPDRVFPERDQADQRLIYRYFNPGAPQVTLNPQDVLHVRGLGFDGLVGYSPVRLARQTFGLNIATETFGASWFGNGARPGGYLKHPGKLGDAAYKHLRESWQAMHGGPDNANRIGIAEEGMEFIAQTIPPEDSQFLGTREFGVEEVARWFNLSPHKLNDLRRATNNNIEQQSIDFVVHSLRPWLVRWEAEVQVKLFTDAERSSLYAEHLVDGLLRGDMLNRYQAYAIGRQWGFLSANDILEKENRNPIEGGDTYLVPVNMQPAEIISAGVQAVKAGTLLPQPPGTIPAPASVPVPEAPDIKADDANADDADLVAQRSAIVSAMRPVMVDAVARIVRREAEKLRRAARQPDTLLEFADRFYAEHRDYVRTALEPAMGAYRQSLEAIGCKADALPNPDTIAAETLAELRATLADANGSTAARLDVLLAEWEVSRPQKTADRLLAQN